jgi:serine/threonine-protein kinase
MANVIEESEPGQNLRLGPTVYLKLNESNQPPAPLLPQGLEGLAGSAREFLDDLLRLRLLTPHSLSEFLEEHQSTLGMDADRDRVAAELIRHNLLTEYQYSRIAAGNKYGLVLGNHKLLRRLGAGGMGVVYFAEHLYLHRHEAIKVLPVDEDCPSALLTRFYSEMQVLAELRHPNIVMAYDAGQEACPSPGLPILLYLVMELVDGGDLEKHVQQNGPAPVGQACKWICQAASGLQEAHDRNLIHRDIKPSNLLLTNRGEIKVVDFGLVQQFCKRLTDRGLLLGSVDFMPPEQASDASTVGPPADIYGLGASLFYLLTGEPPYPRTKKMSEALTAIRNDPPRTLRQVRPDLPAELEAVLTRILHRDPVCRPALPLTVCRELSKFV